MRVFDKDNLIPNQIGFLNKISEMVRNSLDREDVNLNPSTKKLIFELADKCDRLESFRTHVGKIFDLDKVEVFSKADDKKMHTFAALGQGYMGLHPDAFVGEPPVNTIDFPMGVSDIWLEWRKSNFPDSDLASARAGAEHHIFSSYKENAIAQHAEKHQIDPSKLDVTYTPDPYTSGAIRIVVFLK